MTALELWASVQAARDAEAEAFAQWQVAFFEPTAVWGAEADAWAATKAGLVAAEAAFARAVDDEAEQGPLAA